MEESPGTYFDLIFFALLAAAIIYKLFSVLGRTDDGGMPPAGQSPAEIKERPGTEPSRPKLAELQKPTLRAEPEPEITDNKLAQALADIRVKDPRFSPGAFLGGARVAFEMLLKALQDGDKTTLKNLLSAEVYKDFSQELERRQQEGQFPQVTLVSIISSAITEAEVNRAKAVVTVEFVSEQIHVVRDAEQKIIDGNASEVITLTDNWVFERDLRSTNPNWTIIST